MTSGSILVGRPTLVDTVFSRHLVTDAVLVLAGAALTVLLTQLVIPMWPGPVTGASLAALLVGVTLGMTRAVLALGLYLALALAGLPILSGGASGSLLELPSGGYLIGLVFAAAVVGWLAQRRWDRRWRHSVLAVLAGTAVVYAFSLPWRYFSLTRLGPAVWNGELGFDSALAATIGTGLLPFLVGDLVSALLAVLLISAAWRLVRTLSEENFG